MIGALVKHVANGRVIIDSEPAGGGMLFHVSWDEPLVWNESPNHEAEVYQSCWVDDIDVEITGGKMVEHSSSSFSPKA